MWLAACSDRKVDWSAARAVNSEREDEPVGAWPQRNDSGRADSAYIFCPSCSLVFAAFDVYGRALHGPFVFEDFALPFYRPGFPTEGFTA